MGPIALQIPELDHLWDTLQPQGVVRDQGVATLVADAEGAVLRAQDELVLRVPAAARDLSRVLPHDRLLLQCPLVVDHEVPSSGADGELRPDLGPTEPRRVLGVHLEYFLLSLGLPPQGDRVLPLLQNGQDLAVLVPLDLLHLARRLQHYLLDLRPPPVEEVDVALPLADGGDKVPGGLPRELDAKMV